MPRSRSAAATTTIACALVFAAAAAPHAARAQVVFDNGTLDGANSYGSDTNLSSFQAETLTFGATTTFNNVVWYGDYAFSNTPTAPDDFTISLFNTTGGTPNATALFTFNIVNGAIRTPTGGVVSGAYTAFQYSSALPSDVTLGAGTYGISIVNNTTTDTDDDWYWATTGQAGTHYQRTSTTGNFNSTTQKLAFRLVNVAAPGAPEPGTLSLFGMALVSSAGTLGGLRRYRRGRQTNRAAA